MQSLQSLVWDNHVEIAEFYEANEENPENPNQIREFPARTRSCLPQSVILSVQKWMRVPPLWFRVLMLKFAMLVIITVGILRRLCFVEEVSTDILQDVLMILTL